MYNVYDEVNKILTDNKVTDYDKMVAIAEVHQKKNNDFDVYFVRSDDAVLKTVVFV